MTEEGDSHETEGDTADGDNDDCDAGEGGKSRGTETTDSTVTTRRKALKSAGLAGAGVFLDYGAATVTDDDTACEEPLPRTVREYSDGGTGFWLSDNEKLQSRPIYSPSLPGTHHASFYEMTENWLSADFVSSGHVERWTKAQSRDVRTQLKDGVRYLDVRPFYDPEAEEGQPFWGHHEVARGATPEDAFDDRRHIRLPRERGLDSRGKRNRRREAVSHGGLRHRGCARGIRRLPAFTPRRLCARTSGDGYAFALPTESLVVRRLARRCTV